MGRTLIHGRGPLLSLSAAVLLLGVGGDASVAPGRALLTAGGTRIELVLVPAGEAVLGSREAGPDAAPKRVKVDALWMAARETGVAEFAAYLNDAWPAPPVASPQILFRFERFWPARGRAGDPVTGIAFEQAVDYCRWLSARSGRTVRLPTEDEWEYAARGGIRGARYPWGWGDPGGRACFQAEGPRRRGAYAPNPFGLYDMAGNVFEWCAPDDTTPPGFAPARGGSWAEKDPRMLRVYRRADFPPDYRDADVGFRVVVEEGATLNSQHSTFNSQAGDASDVER